MVYQSSVSLVKRRWNVMGYGRMDLLSMSLSDQSGTESAGHINTFETYLGQRLSLSRYPGQSAGPPAPRTASCCHWNVTLSSSWHRLYSALTHLCWLGDSQPSTGVHPSMMTWMLSETICSSDHESMQFWVTPAHCNICLDERRKLVHTFSTILTPAYNQSMSQVTKCIIWAHTDSTCLLDLPFTFG